ncbi:MAG: hypothetical protein CSA95_04455 [Bacteroidetes bacterium]|nr:MAG: hypothetical protein CSA95_04455 [Bacteroidota bacterium]PIE88801.1 MAG: hypothetical protein CSA04_00020 [Bacteroidota bacterium]
MNYPQKSGIKTWAKEDRPREKLIQKGRSVLSNAELLAILIGSGTRKETALDLSRKVFQHADNNLAELGRLERSSLMEIKGIGEAKALIIIAAMELARRRASTSSKERKQISNSEEAFELMRQYLSDEPYEQFWILLLDRSNRVIQPVQISHGGVSGTVVDPKRIFTTALRGRASGIILFHNHPSGNIRPSEADKGLTKKLASIGTLMEIVILDHLIIGKENYFSFSDQGLL